MQPENVIYANCLGIFVIDSNGNIVDQERFNEADSLKFMTDKDISGSALVDKHPDLKVLNPDKLPPDHVLEAFRDEKFFKDFRDLNIVIAREKIKASFTRDELIVQTVALIEDIEKHANSLVKRLRDLYMVRLPEASHRIESNERFVATVLTKTDDEILQELNVDKSKSMGVSLEEDDNNNILILAQETKSLYDLKDKYGFYLEGLMKKSCSNIYALVGTMIGGKLIALAGGLEKLSLFPASTIQLLGAEKALFRHIKTGARSPKFGVLLMHPLVADAKKADRGRIARALADKISIASKVDHFKGDPIGERLRIELEKKFGTK